VKIIDFWVCEKFWVPKMPSEQKIYQPDPKLARSSYVSSFQQYEELYKESIESEKEFLFGKN
jgi:hypothetical protein